MRKYVDEFRRCGQIVSVGPLCCPVSVKRNVIWLTNSINTNKFTVLYITYFTINFLLHVSAQLSLSWSLDQCC
jgi:hypothetical protein